METLIWCFFLHIALWCQSKLWKPFYFVLIEAGSCFSQYKQKKGYCILGDWSCSGISIIKPEIMLQFSILDERILLFLKVLIRVNSNGSAIPVQTQRLIRFRVKCLNFIYGVVRLVWLWWQNIIRIGGKWGR